MITIVNGPKVSTTIKDARELNLDPKWEQRLSQIMYENRMDYELQVDHADDYHELCKKLKAKGYANLPNNCHFAFPEMVTYRQQEHADIKTLSKVKPMTRRANQPAKFIHAGRIKNYGNNHE